MKTYSTRTLLVRGFTLIELIVVVAIIAILSSVVIAVLSSAQASGADTAVKSNLTGTRAEAQAYYDASATLSFDGVCTTNEDGIGDAVNAAERAYKRSVTLYADGTASTWDTAQCHDRSDAWAAWVPLKASTPTAVRAWCVDSTGTAKLVTSVLMGAACP